MTSVGLRCPICGSWYTDDAKMYTFWEIDEICGNESGKGFDPSKCCTEHPCDGKLVRNTPELAEKFRKKKNGLR